MYRRFQPICMPRHRVQNAIGCMSFPLSVEVSNPSFVLGIYWTIIQHPEPARVGNSYGVMIRRRHLIARKDCPFFDPRRMLLSTSWPTRMMKDFSAAASAYPAWRFNKLALRIDGRS